MVITTVLLNGADDRVGGSLCASDWFSVCYTRRGIEPVLNE